MDFPETITREDFRAAMVALGIPTAGLIEVESTAQYVRVTYKRRGSDGLWLVADGELATTVVTIPLV